MSSPKGNNQSYTMTKDQEELGVKVGTGRRTSLSRKDGKRREVGLERKHGLV